MRLVYTPKFCITIFLDFSLDDSNTQEKLEIMVMQNLGGGGGKQYTWRLMEVDDGELR